MTERRKDALAFFATLLIAALCGVMLAWRG